VATCSPYVAVGVAPLTTFAACSMLWALTATLKWALPLRTSIETFTIVASSAGRILSLLTLPDDPRWIAATD
jgi:hypothetical protein